jgi:hypothetical protein
MVKPPNQLIETIEGAKHRKVNVVFTIHEPPCFMHDALWGEYALEWQKEIQNELVSFKKTMHESWSHSLLINM